MKNAHYYFTGLAGIALVAGAAQAQPADVPANDHAAPHADASAPAADATVPAATPAEPAIPATPADPAAEAAAVPATPAEPATPAQPAAQADMANAADLTETEIDSFAKATVKLQEIQADATIAADQKQTAMAAAVNEAGLDPAQYNAIGRAAQSDAELRAKVQTAMSRYVSAEPTEG